MLPIPSLLRRRGATALALVLITCALGAFAARVKPDYSIEHCFPTFDQSRVDYERFKRDFPFEDARALVLVQADDLYSQDGLKRIAALEADLSRVSGVLDTQSIVSVKDLTSDGINLRMDRLFPEGTVDAESLDRGKRTATTDPIFHHTLAAPDQKSTAISVTLTKEIASKEETRTLFFQAAKKVVEQHAALAKTRGITQQLTLNGLPIVRSEFTAMVARDLGVLFPLALLIILVLLYVAFRRVTDVLAALLTIYVSIIWTVGFMGILGVPLHALTQITPIVVMIISISDTVHVVTHMRELLAGGATKFDAVSRSAVDNLWPCLLTEVTIAFGFLALMANDMVMIQQFGMVTAAGMMLTWLANFTVLPLLLLLFPAGKPAQAGHAPQKTLPRFIGWVEQVVIQKPRRVALVTVLLSVGFAALGTQVGKEYYAYDDLRPDAQLNLDLRRIEAAMGGSVPMAVFVEPQQRTADAMLEPQALALIDRITTRLESEFGSDVKNAASLSKYVKKAHRLLVGDEAAASEPLPETRRLAVQELLAVDDPRALRDVVNFDRSVAAVFTSMPDRGSSQATQVLERLHTYLAEEEKATGYRLTVTGIYGIADGIYRNMVGGLAASLGLAVLVSFAMFFAVLRSWQLALIALVPNLLPLLVTIGTMALLGIDIKPSTVMVFSITLVIADDDTIQFLTRFRSRFLGLGPDATPHRTAVLGTLRESGTPMLITTLAVTIGFLALLRSEFVGLANLGLLLGVSLLSAVAADLFLTPILIMALKPKLGPVTEKVRESEAEHSVAL
jgi:predicted RND superfamily exporter protein